MAERLVYTADHMDEMIRKTQAHRSKLIAAGHIDHFGREVHPPTTDGAGAVAPEPPTHEAHCLKCRTKRTVVTKKLHPSTKGKAARAVGDCPVCGTETHKFVGADTEGQMASSLQSTLAQQGGV